MKCSIEWCDDDVVVKGKCRKHYSQFYLHGRNFKSFRDPNEMIVLGDITKIILRDRRGVGVAEAVIDTVDIEKASAHVWFFVNGYPTSQSLKDGRKRRLTLSNWLCDSDDLIDHADGDTLNTRRYNLRDATPQENAMNSKTQSNSRSGVKGVTFHKASGKWAATIYKSGKQKWLGLFVDISAAIAARRKAAIEIQGSFASEARHV